MAFILYRSYFSKKVTSIITAMVFTTLYSLFLGIVYCWFVIRLWIKLKFLYLQRWINVLNVLIYWDFILRGMCTPLKLLIQDSRNGRGFQKLLAFVTHLGISMANNEWMRRNPTSSPLLITATPCFIIAFRLFWWEGIGAKVRINSREKLTQLKCYENLFLLSGLRHMSCQHDTGRNPEVTKILDFFELDASLPSLYYQVIRERPPSGWVFVACACFPGEFYTFTFL